jgi:hypothetical protein
MKRRRLHAHHRMSRDAERLVWLANGLADSGSRVEDGFWESELEAVVLRLLGDGGDEPLTQALDRLYETNGRAYDELADFIESVTEGGVVDTPEGPRRALLIALPVLTWSRYLIPTRSLTPAQCQAVKVHLAAHVLAAPTQVALADYLFSPDQLPRGYAETHAFATRLWQAAAAGQDLAVDAGRLAESGQFISDVRYLLGAVLVPTGAPVFRWNEADGNRDTAQRQWQTQGSPHFTALMPGCAAELLLPDAYFSAWRRADREGRPHSLRAAAAYLQTMLDVPAAKLRAVVAPSYDRRLEEWRIGFGLHDSAEVLHGVVWPLLGAEDEGHDMGAEIEQVLKEAGVGEVVVLEQRFPFEFCEDCGAPMFPNIDGEVVHAEMPEQTTDSAPLHLH